jgi:peptidoglycan hydrolase CwlO-like protein
MSAGLHELRAIVTSNRETISYLNRELDSQRGVIETLKREKLRLEAQADEEKDAHLLEVETLKEKLRVAENERESALATVNAERAERDTLLEMNQRLSERLRQALSTFHTANMVRFLFVRFTSPSSTSVDVN